jgi:hypothetical protein
VFDNLVLTDREFCNVSDLHGNVTGFQVKLRIPQYRGLPLAMLQDLRVTVDGEAFAGQKLRLLYDGRNYSLDDLKSLFDVYWCYEKFVTVISSKPGGLSTGMHTVEVRLLLDTGPPNVPRMRAWDIAKDADLLEKTYQNAASGTGMARVTKKMTLVQ